MILLPLLEVSISAVAFYFLTYRKCLRASLVREARYLSNTLHYNLITGILNCATLLINSFLFVFKEAKNWPMPAP